MLFLPAHQVVAGESMKIVQMKRNGSNCHTGKNLDKMQEESHFMSDGWKQTKICEFLSNHRKCGGLYTPSTI